jgi:integrase
MNSQGGRRHNTTKRLIRNIKDFQRFSEKNDIKLYVVPTNELRNVFKDYLVELSNRDKLGSRGGLSRGTIKSYLQGVRYFFDWLVREKELDGLSLFPSHPITLDFQNQLIRKELGNTTRKGDTVKFKVEYYKECYQTCNKKVRELWSNYCSSNGRINGLVDSNGKVNQPSVILGRDFIYFIGLLQLRGGFRIGEILYSYRNMDIYNEHHLTNHNKEMGSYWSRSENDGWLLNIRNSKGKNRTIPVNDKIWSWVKPPQGVEYQWVEDANKGHYETYLVDVIMSMFPDSFYMFPSPNHLDNPNSPRSKTHTMNLFKQTLVTEEGWERYGIKSSHNLRSFFISYMIRKDDISPLQVCEITGHTLKVMEKYYLRENLQSKYKTYKTVTQRDLLL